MVRWNFVMECIGQWPKCPNIIDDSYQRVLNLVVDHMHRSRDINLSERRATKGKGVPITVNCPIAVARILRGELLDTLRREWITAPIALYRKADPHMPVRWHRLRIFRPASLISLNNKEKYAMERAGKAICRIKVFYDRWAVSHLAQLFTGLLRANWISGYSRL